MASFVIANPWLRLLGALYLIKLAFENLAVSPEAEGGSAGHGQHAVGVGFWLVVLNVELADLAFSIDNVVAAVALSDQLWVVLLGVALGIVTMRFAAGIFAYLIRRQPILEPAAYILVLAIGIELVLADVYHFHFNHLTKFMISIGILALCLLYARFQVLTLFDPLLCWLGEGMGYLNNLVNWLFKPLLLVLKLLFYPVRRLFATEPKPAHLHNPLEPADSSHTELAEG
jgi:tellurite resistance protein TerC